MAGLVVHEWVESAGGSEKVVEEFLETFPDADLRVLWDDAPGRFRVKSSESWLARTPFRRHKALALPMLPAVWRAMRSEVDYDWMLISSHLFAHHARIRTQPDLSRLVYVHTPARYIWEPELDSRGSGLLPRLVAATLKPIDRRRAGDSTALAANSEFTRSRIDRAWRRDAAVIYPPVDTERLIAGGDWATHLGPEDAELLGSLPTEFLLGASRFVSYKRLDLVVAAGEATRIPVVLAGSGPELPRLQRVAEDASIPVRIIDRPSDALLYALYQRSTAFVFPAIEDFGIMPVEAMACGTPVIAPLVGGAAESVNLLRGGAITTGSSPGAWRAALIEASSVDREALRARTLALSVTRFRQEIQAWVKEHE
ncbi:glycosyltransferase [Microbacterium terregens]|uniref:GDP-Man:Man(1)GlcNAc(2)-PP-Dol alpha-1,3-mannosyltransferase n=1 Tax=Microbacterium terregens TaxID=69363 RepID=A0ABV5T380_9MICO